MNDSTPLSALLMICLILGAGAVEASATENDYLNHAYWDSGKAEFQRLEGRIQKYGIDREAAARLVLVKEPFDPHKRVKSLAPDALPVLKMLFFRHIPTGVYDYFQTATLFFDRQTGRVLKYTMSSQDGCGNTFMDYLYQPDRTHRFRYFSYFDDEGDSETVLKDTDFTFYDALPLVLRFRLKDGARYSLQLMESLIANKKQPLTVHPAAVRVNRITDKTLAGQSTSEAFAVTVQREDRQDRFFYEPSFPHRLIRWEKENGDILFQTAADFFYYWNYTRPEHRDYLENRSNSE
ncbi:MAG: hypothetical protein ACOC3W_02105 [Thermodesulfobacteriota bacterium]